MIRMEMTKKTLLTDKLQQYRHETVPRCNGALPLAKMPYKELVDLSG